MNLQFKITLILLVYLLFTSCDKESESEDMSRSLTAYTIVATVTNDETSQPVTNVRIKVGANDSGLNPEFSSGCRNLGSQITNANGKATFITPQYADYPVACNVQCFDLDGNELIVDYGLINSSAGLNLLVRIIF